MAKPSWNGELDWVKRVDNVVDRFLGWIPWDERDDLEMPSGAAKKHAREYPGVYMFAEFMGRVPSQVSCLDNDIFYVGETHRPLGKRWYEYRNWIRNRMNRDIDRVYVAALPTCLASKEGAAGEDDEVTKHFRLYTERRIIWERVLAKKVVQNSR